MNGLYAPGFTGFSIMFTIVFVLIVSSIIYSFYKEIKQNKLNKQSPRLTVEATLVTKRTNTESYGGEHRHTSTDYYVTFQVESGDRIEFEVTGIEYGMLVEGDRGKLTFQGTQYLGFERQ